MTLALHDTHILLLMKDAKASMVLRRIFESMGATVYASVTQHEAIGLYWHLFRAGIKPRAIVTSWLLADPDSQEYEFLRMLGREKIDGTALNFLTNILDLDPGAFTAVYTKDPGHAKGVLYESKIHSEIFGKDEITPAELAIRIATHDGIAKQRVDPAEVAREVRALEAQHKLSTTSSCEITA